MNTSFRKRSTRLLCVLSMLAGPGVAAAGCSATGCTGTVEKIFAKIDGNTSIQIAGDKSVVNCTAVSGVYFTLYGSDAGAKNIMAMLLVAQSTGREIFVRISEGTTNCKVAYATLQ